MTFVNEALFCTGVTTLLRDPLGRPILGASNHYFAFINLRG